MYRPCDVGEEDKAPRAEPEGERGGGVVGVHVQRPDCERRDHGHQARRERSENSRRAARQRVADLAERRHRHGQQPVAVAEHRHRELSERGAELGVDLGHRFAHDLERLMRRAPPAADELDGIERRCISRVICGPAPCTTQTWWPSSTRPRMRSADSPATAPPTFTTSRDTAGADTSCSLTTGTPR